MSKLCHAPCEGDGDPPGAEMPQPRAFPFVMEITQ